MNYAEYLQSKKTKILDAGFSINRDLINKSAFEFQKDITCWALKKGRSAIFADCGLGKTLMQLEWSQKVHNYTNGNVLILAPLSVSKQTKEEGDIVFTPFAGIGSELYQPLLMKRRAIGIELKQSYFKQGVENCKNAELSNDQMSIFDFLEV